MKDNSSISIGLQTVLLAIVSIAVCSFEPAYCQTTGTALLLQQTPAGGGKVTPDVGIHHFDLYADVTLTAVPKQGYQFVYWLGDVSDPTTVRTTVYLDAPKIIIAVFERTEFELPEEIEASTDSYGLGGFAGPAGDYYGGGGGGGAIKAREWRWPRRRPPKEPEPEEDWPDFPADGKNADFPAIPEPATGLLLALGGMLTLTSSRVKKRAR